MNLRLLYSLPYLFSFSGVQHGWCPAGNGQSGWRSGRRSFGMYGARTVANPAVASAAARSDRFLSGRFP